MSAQVTPLYKVSITLGVLNSTDVTLSSDGSLFIDLPWPIPNVNAAIPVALLPPGARPHEDEDLGTRWTKAACMHAVTSAFVVYLIEEWLWYDANVAWNWIRSLFTPPASPPEDPVEDESYEGLFDDFEDNLLFDLDAYLIGLGG